MHIKFLYHLEIFNWLLKISPSQNKYEGML